MDKVWGNNSVDADRINIVLGDGGIGRTFAAFYESKDKKNVFLLDYRGRRINEQFPAIFAESDSRLKKICRGFFRVKTKNLSFEEGLEIYSEAAKQVDLKKDADKGEDKVIVMIEGASFRSKVNRTNHERKIIETRMNDLAYDVARLTNTMRNVHGDKALVFICASDSSLSMFKRIPHFGSRLNTIIIPPAEKLTFEEMKDLLGSGVTEADYEFLNREVGGNFCGLKQIWQRTRAQSLGKCKKEKLELSLNGLRCDIRKGIDNSEKISHMKINKLPSLDAQSFININDLDYGVSNLVNWLVDERVLYRVTESLCKVQKWAVPCLQKVQKAENAKRWL
eukprot:TRINITY_DN429_c0_g1_i1.p1 TRINITY_DN429_c0_g1~~TRINITY_DN429_c0_g1_i1.p1  ORF type:complete len:394 (+),score=85.30 TRINITY_DN429_c0_g1_i1:173-1183(+)